MLLLLVCLFFNSSVFSVDVAEWFNVRAQKWNNLILVTQFIHLKNGANNTN